MTETVKQRYEREAKARLATRAGADLAEEFFSVAADAEDRDVVVIAELMAAAYNMGVHAMERDELPAICENGCPQGYLGRHKMSCGEGRRRYAQDKENVPDADPGNPELRLLRAIYGLCPECDRTDQHIHEE